MLHKRIAHHLVQHVAPTKHNGFVPRILREPAIWAMLGVSVALFGFSQFLRTTDYLNIKAEVLPTVLVELTNQDRVSLGMHPLVVSPVLERAAQLKVRDMIENNYFAHTSPTGVTPWHWFARAGYGFRYAGENLAVNFSESTDVESAWLNSPTHRANVLSANFTQIGIATAQGVYKGAPTTFVVQLFGTPASSADGVRTSIPSVPVRTRAADTVNDPRVAGESTSTLRTVDESPTFVSVQNNDPLLVVEPTPQTPQPKVSWFSRFILDIDTYIGAILEVFVVGLIIALAGLATREHEKHHRRHYAYGLLMLVVLTSLLFVGRIGVFAETPTVPVHLPYLEF